jgi:tryptophan synthase alpha subunit
MTNVADGAIIGSAIVNIVKEKKEDSPKAVYEFAKSIVDVLK